MKLRRLTEEGLERFAAYLDATNDHEVLEVPRDLLESPTASVSVGASVEVVPRSFANRYELAEHLYAMLGNADVGDMDRDRGLWGWLSLFYFDELCPAKATGQRDPGRRERWILVPTSRKFYLHLLAGPYLIYRAHLANPEITIGLLCGPLNVIPRVYEEIAESPALIANPAVVEVATRLYYDPAKRAVRRNRSLKAGPRRFVQVLAQYDVTWDLRSLTTDDLFDMLPKEFELLRSAYQPDLIPRSDIGEGLRPTARLPETGGTGDGEYGAAIGA